MHARLHLTALLLVALLGLGFVLGPEFTLALLSQLGLLDAVPEMPPPAMEYVQFVYGVLGAVMVGWAALLGLVAHAPRLDARRAVGASLVLWFVLDTGLSLASGHPRNAGLNLVCLVATLVPLALMPAASNGDVAGTPE